MDSTTSLTSPTTLNTSGNGAGGKFFVSGGFGGSLPTNFSLPVSFVGTNDTTQVEGVSVALKSGTSLSGSSSTNNALVSSQMAGKNNLSVGSSFTAYNATMTVVGIFTSSDKTVQGTVILSLPTLQKLSGQSGDVTSAVATVDSLDNLSSATAAIKTALEVVGRRQRTTASR